MKISLSIGASFVLPLMLTSLIDAQGINISSKTFASSSSTVSKVSTVSTVKETTVRGRKLISQATSPGTYYVSGSGSDSNDGLSTSSAFRTIQKASNLATPGDTVLIMNGVYTNAHAEGEALLIQKSGTPNAWIRFKAYPGHSPKIKHNGWNGILIKRGAAYVEVSGLEIEGNNNNVSYDYAYSQRYNESNPLTNGNCITIDGRYGNGIRPHHIRIINNKVHDCGGAGIVAMHTDYVTIDRNEVFNNAWDSSHGNSGISIWQPWNSDDNKGYKLEITNNKVYNNRQYIPWAKTGKVQDGNGIILDDFRSTQAGSTLGVYRGRSLVANNLTFNNGGSGIHTFKSEHIDIVNNVAYLNNQSPEVSHGQIFANASTDVKIFNNILYAYPGKKMNMDWQNIDVVYAYNIYANAPARSIAIIGSNDIVGDPQFVNPSTNPAVANFRLKSTSPGFNTGAWWDFLENDIVGNPRPSGGAYDRGAYEVQQ